MRILDHYIARQIILATAIVLLVLLGVQSFMEFIRQLSYVGKESYTLSHAVAYVLMQMPAELYELFPMAGFLGSLIGLGHLANGSELVVMQTSAVSIGRITWSVIKAALIMAIVVSVLGEGLSPWLQARSEVMKDAATGSRMAKLRKLNGLWLRHGNRFVHIGQIISPTKTKNIYVYQFDDQQHLKMFAHAGSSSLKEGRWQLENIALTEIDADKTTVKHPESMPLGVEFRPDMLQKTRKTVDQQSLGSLLRTILYRRKTGLLSSQFEYAFWQRILQPLTTIVMICFGIPFIFGSLRSSSMGVRVMTGVIVGFGFYMLNQFFGPITMVYSLPPLLAATLPTLFFAMIYFILIRRVR